MNKKKKIYRNGLNNVLNNIRNSYMYQPAIQNMVTNDINTRNNLLTYNRTNLSYRYATDGIFKTLIQQPIQDAMKGELQIKTDQLDEEEKEDLKDIINKKNIINTVKNLFVWNRLYGGAALIIEVANQDCGDKLRFKDIEEGADVNFYAIDRWELSGSVYETLDQIKEANYYDKYFYYYSNRINSERLILLKGVEAPSLIRSSLMGWGLSAAEPLIEPSNIYKNTINLIYELMSEAKIDVYKIQGLNDLLATATPNNNNDNIVIDRLEIANRLKNYLNSIALDSEDDFIQKQLNFSGYVDILKELKLDICSAMKIPATKVWGMSASGFSTGEDDIMNYYTMIDGEIRPQLYNVLIKIIKILVKAEYGILLTDLKVAFDDLVIIKQNDIEQSKQRQYTMFIDMYDKKLLTKKELGEALKQADIYTSQARFTEEDDYSDFTSNNEDKLDI